MRPAIALALFFCAVVHAQQPTQSFHYKNAEYEYIITYPANYQSVTKATFPANSCFSNPFSTAPPMSLEGKEALMNLATTNDCSRKRPTAAALPGVAKEDFRHFLTAYLGTPSLTVPIPYKLGGYDSVFLEGAATTQLGHRFYAGRVCSLFVTGTLCWTAVAATPAHLRVLLASPIAWDGNPATPLVPAHLIEIGGALNDLSPPSPPPAIP